jgi:GNAT superfamily N-acetyltransferase
MSLNAALAALNPLAGYQIREAGPGDAADLFILQAAIASTGAGEFLAWTQQLEERLETGSLAWIATAGRRPVGMALIDPLPGLPGVFELNGGIIPARQRQGAGTRLLARVVADAGAWGGNQLSCRVDSLAGATAGFLLRRGFFIEHEECLLERRGLDDLPAIPTRPGDRFISYARERAVTEFCRLYLQSFSDAPWSQPYSPDEVEETLVEAEDLLFWERDGAPVGVAWLEVAEGGRARIEPIGIDRDYQGQGFGHRLLLAALHEFRRRGANLVEIGLWRNNIIAMHLYQSLGFAEVANWYYLAYDLAPRPEQ